MAEEITNGQLKEIHQIKTEDNRRGERRILQTGDGCTSSKVTEVYLEPQPQLLLSQRVIEETCPMVCKRVTEKFDANGQIIEQVTEGIPAEKQLTIVDHIVSATSPPAPEYVTKDEFKALAGDFKGRSLLEDNVKNSKTETLVNALLGIIFLGELAGLGYIVFLM